jgi:uncharacterized protein YjbJ (UPF0337 family)
MKTGIRDQVEGAVHQATGSIKQAVGKLSDNPKLNATGTVEKYAGKAQEKLGQVKRVLGK